MTGVEKRSRELAAMSQVLLRLAVPAIALLALAGSAANAGAQGTPQRGHTTLSRTPPPGWDPGAWQNLWNMCEHISAKLAAGQRLEAWEFSSSAACRSARPIPGGGGANPNATGVTSSQSIASPVPTAAVAPPTSASPDAGASLAVAAPG